MNGQKLLVVLIALLVVYAMFLIVSIVLIDRQPNDWKGGTLLGLTTTAAAVGAGGSFAYWKFGDKLRGFTKLQDDPPTVAPPVLEYDIESDKKWSELELRELNYEDKDIWDRLAEKIKSFVVYYNTDSPPSGHDKNVIVWPLKNIENTGWLYNDEKIPSVKDFYKDCKNDNVKKIIVLWGIALSITGMGGSHTERHENIYPGMKHFLPGGILHESIPKWKLDELSTEKEFYKAVNDIFIICTMLDIIYRCRGNEEMYDCIKTNSENYLDSYKNLLLEYGIYDILNEHHQNLLSKYDSSWWRNLLNKIPIRFIKM